MSRSAGIGTVTSSCKALIVGTAKLAASSVSEAHPRGRGKTVAGCHPPKPRFRRAWLAARGALLAALYAGTAIAAPSSKLIPYWDASDDTSTDSIEHSAWQDILSEFLRLRTEGTHRFDYAALKADATSAVKLGKYLDSLQRLDPRSHSRAEQKAYWINFYNALTVQVVLEKYPVDSIRSISKRFFRRVAKVGPWSDSYARVAGRDVALGNIEHGILRPIWNDNRLHYALNCASASCPSLSPTAFTAENTEQQLETLARAYVNDPAGVSVENDGLIVLSSLYEWYAEDFGDSERGVLEHLARYAEPELAERLRNFQGKIRYEYDWSLNQP